MHYLDKHYLDKHYMEHRTPDEGGDSPLPIAFESAGDAVDIDLRVADDVEKASVTLRLTFEGLQPGADRVLAEVNGKVLEMRTDDVQLVFEDTPISEKDNTLRIVLEKRDDTADSPFRVEGAELIVSYGSS